MLDGAAYYHNSDNRCVGIPLNPDVPRRKAGDTWHEDGRDYFVKSVTRRELLGGGWQTLLDIMEVLAKRYGADCVRMVVWFS